MLRRHNNLWTIALATVLVSMAATSDSIADWRKEGSQGYQLTLSGEILPPRGIYMDRYYAGELEVGKGENENELAVMVKLVIVTPQANTFRQPESGAKGYLRCAFYEKESITGLGENELAQISIPAGEQGFMEVENGQVLKINVPDHAACVFFRLFLDRRGEKEAAWFQVARPYRTEQMRAIEAQRARQNERNALQAGKQVQEVACSKCKGTGKVTVPGKEVTCPRCRGEGWYPPGTGHMRERCGKDFMAKLDPREKTCGGTGKITEPAHDEACDACGGTGKVRKIVDNPLIKE